MSIRLTRWGHACIRLDRGGDRLVIDPGVFSDLPAALDGVQAVLVTHEHPDHVATEPLAEAAQGGGVQVWAPQSVVDALVEAGAPADRVHPVSAGETFSAGGFDVAALGEWHALVHQDVPRIHNVGYLVEGVLHPGDAFIDPAGSQVDVLCTPLGAPWLKLGEVVDYVRSVGPGRIVVVHDALLSAIGQGMAIALLGRLGGAGEPVALDPGEGIDL
ncbi:MBL fold metallo-hydrolase [Cellulomonas humilata]|uniref:L-ascorbate metabolism protein UlaG (Beta-lactamase superfamily) n=1 Tax=Cellulomonas humilata TaxID=144055 RepID=A0ABU0EGY1_9CELL|nr:MBL fold metallo-hydrolase [Cellulomonas humilata]MDQ0374539.1 L-ascorbate metabolism protein UlaG (beta-lactamase superfamily) [Cellulomonas humilata]